MMVEVIATIYNYWKTVEDYSFWDNDPSKYIYCGTEIGMDPIGYVQRYDQQSGLLLSGLEDLILIFPDKTILYSLSILASFLLVQTEELIGMILYSKQISILFPFHRLMMI